ncbi:MAG: maltose acetyltransferase domain-containing protein [Clostridia bacterium]
MGEEEKIMKGILFCPGDPELRRMKLRSHNLCAEYNRTYEDETEKRQELISQIVGEIGEGGFMQGANFFSTMDAIRRSVRISLAITI